MKYISNSAVTAECVHMQYLLMDITRKATELLNRMKDAF